MTHLPTAAVGLRAHSGWAVLVIVGGSRQAPSLVDRRRIDVAEHTPSQPYHEAASVTDLAAAEQMIERARAQATARARAAIGQAVAAARQAGYEARRAAVLVKVGRPLPPLDAILRSHPLLHTAEGELFREVLINGCEACNLEVVHWPERDAFEKSSRSLGMTVASLNKQLAALGRSCGPPWTADHKIACAAAMSLLTL